MSVSRWAPEFSVEPRRVETWEGSLCFGVFVSSVPRCVCGPPSGEVQLSPLPLSPEHVCVLNAAGVARSSAMDSLREFSSLSSTSLMGSAGEARPKPTFPFKGARPQAGFRAGTERVG